MQPWREHVSRTITCLHTNHPRIRAASLDLAWPDLFLFFFFGKILTGSFAPFAPPGSAPEVASSTLSKCFQTKLDMAAQCTRGETSISKTRALARKFEKSEYSFREKYSKCTRHYCRHACTSSTFVALTSTYSPGKCAYCSLAPLDLNLVKVQCFLIVTSCEKCLARLHVLGALRSVWRECVQCIVYVVSKILVLARILARFFNEYSSPPFWHSFHPYSVHTKHLTTTYSTRYMTFVC